MAELDLMAPGRLCGVPAHPPAALSPDSGSASPTEEEDLGSPGSPPGETGGQGSEWQGAPEAESLEEEEEVLCDFCLGASRVRAVKSCLTCMVNYCPEHLRPHQENSRLHGHQLTEPARDRDLRLCPTHRSPLIAFCDPDGRCICEECSQAEHRGHALVSLDVARRDKEVSAGVWGRGRWGGRVSGEAARPLPRLLGRRSLSLATWRYTQPECLLHLALGLRCSSLCPHWPHCP